MRLIEREKYLRDLTSLADGQLSVTEAARILGKCPHAVWKFARNAGLLDRFRPRIRWNNNEALRVMRDHRAGMKVEEIAVREGTSRSRIYTVIARGNDVERFMTRSGGDRASTKGIGDGPL